LLKADLIQQGASVLQIHQNVDITRVRRLATSCRAKNANVAGTIFGSDAQNRRSLLYQDAIHVVSRINPDPTKF
jgi:hypothetical protein